MHPSTPYCLVIDCILATITGLVAVAVGTSPGTQPVAYDIVAVIGAMLATVIAVLDARKRDSTPANTVIVILGSSCVGSMLPGVLFCNVWPELATRFTWHIWAALGFLAGLMGWTIVRAVCAVIERRKDSILSSLEERYLPRRANPPREPPDVQDDVPMK